MLDGFQVQAAQRVSHLQRRQALLGVIVFGIVPAFQIEGTEAGKHQYRAGGAEVVSLLRLGAAGVYIHGGRLGLSVGHLAGQHASPDKAVEPELVVVEIGLQRIGIPPNGSGSDGLVSFLGRL